MNFKSILFTCSMVLLMGTGAFANNMLVQNVTTLGNDPINKTIQVQFDISWDNSWRDAINYDAAWIFMKFKNASGVWQHVQLNQTGIVAGTGTANTVQVTADKVGSWLYRSGLGSGTFTSTGMQLQWNYALAGLTSVTGLEVRVFAVEMVYVPEGDFNVAKENYNSVQNGFHSDVNLGRIYAPGNNFPVINQRLSPKITYSIESTMNIRVRGDVGIDSNNDGVVDNTTYPIGFRAFYSFKYELTEQQYADFLNTLTITQSNNLGIAGGSISLINGQYFSSSPNKACINSNSARIHSYADWSGVRPLTILELNKASYGPIQPFYSDLFEGYPAWGSDDYSFAYEISDVGSQGTPTSTRVNSGSSYYGIMDLTGNAIETVVGLSGLSFSNANGNGILSVNGNSDEVNWPAPIIRIEQTEFVTYDSPLDGTNYSGFRYVRSAE
jgi:hypothetical protein